MSTGTVPFSRLLQHPTDTVAKLERSRNRRLRLGRRDGEDLILETAGHAEAGHEAMNMTTRLFVSLVSRDEAARVLLLALPDVFPWVRFLPPGDAQAFLLELVETARACAELDNMAPLEPVVAAWRAAAEVYADPELRATLALPLEDHGAVPGPC
jgi:hypothetical protein